MFGKQKKPVLYTRWIIHNYWEKTADGMGIEFAECENCGHEEEPNMGALRYPMVCHGCGRLVNGEMFPKV